MKQKFFIDTHKAATFFFVLGIMAVYQRWDLNAAWIYLALHGGYGFLWVLKSRIFPDSSWEQPCKLSYGLAIWGGLSLYWVAPWLLISRGVEAPGWHLALCVFLYIFGVFFHFSADMQKYTGLRLRPGELIDYGFLARLRNTNYFGELLIYLAFALLAMHWLPLIVLLIWIALVWLPRMRRKDAVLATLPGFEQYRQRSWLFIPGIF